MRRRYWLSALLVLVPGIVTLLVSSYYGFVARLVCIFGAGILFFGLLDMLTKRFPKGARRVRNVLRVLLAVLLLVVVGTGIWVGVCSKGDADESVDYVIVLGAGVNGTVPSQALRERLTATKAYLDAHPQAIAVLSGGQGDHENITEAECMFRWLTEAGIDESRLRKEERAATTQENLRNSLALLEEEFGARPERVGVVSSEYHLCRAELLAKQEGVTALGIPAYTRNRVYFLQMLLREVCGVWYTLLF